MWSFEKNVNIMNLEIGQPFTHRNQSGDLGLGRENGGRF